MKNNEHGVTLIEILATLTLLSIILLLANSVHLFGQNQMSVQSKVIETQTNERLAINLITKEIRKAQKVEVKAVNELTINSSDVYKLDGTILKKNNETFMTKIDEFHVEKSGNRIKLSINSIPETIIYIRD